MGAASLFLGKNPDPDLPEKKQTSDAIPDGENFGFFDTVKNALSNIVGIVLVAIVVLATVVAPQIMIPVLAVYGIWKFADTLTTIGDEPDLNEKKNQFWFWLFLLIVALVVYWLKSRK